MATPQPTGVQVAVIVNRQANLPTYTLTSNYPSSVLSTMFEHKTFSDIKLSGTTPLGSEGQLQPIEAHKNVLSAASKHLRDLFASEGYTDSQQSTQNFDNINHSVLQTIVQIIYNGTVSLTDANCPDQICQILAAADYLQINDIVDACEKHLSAEENLTLTNYVNMWCFAHKYSRLNLMQASSKAIATSLPQIMLREDFLKLSVNELTKLMLSEGVITANGNERCLAVVAWLNYDAKTRASEVHNVLNLVPHEVGEVPPTTILAIYDNEIIRSAATSQYHRAFVEGNKKRKLDDSPAEKISRQQRRAWYIVGGSNALTQHQFLEYDIQYQSWTKLTNLPWSRAGCAAGIMENSLIVVGGTKGNMPTPDIDAFNFSTGIWGTKKAKLHETQYKSIACIGGLSAYVFGGNWDRSSSERYTFGANSTTRLPSINYIPPIYTTTFGTDHNAIYVAGRNNATNDCILKLDVSNHQWSQFEKPVIARNDMASVILGDDLYLLGGKDIELRHDNDIVVEIFNVVRGGKTRVGPPLPVSRRMPAATTLNNNLVCVLGGSSKNDDMLKSIAVLDIREGKWSTGKIVPDMPLPSMGFGLATV